MTLILTYADRNCVIQLSDRRVTHPDVEPNDRANKATLITDRCTIAFTGLAYVGPTRRDTPTDEWMVKVLPKHKPYSMSDACNALRTEATAAFSAVPLSRKVKGVAFVAAGWTFTDCASDAQPTIALVTNALRRTHWENEAAAEFWTDVGGLGERQPFVLLPFGQPVDKRRYFGAVRRIRRGLRAGNSYKFVMENMATIALNTARDNPLVGTGLNVVPSQAAKRSAEANVCNMRRS